MKAALENAQDLARTFSLRRDIAIGQGAPDFPDLGLSGSFTDVVSGLYRWYYEGLREDRGFLDSHVPQASRQHYDAFIQNLNDQRHLNEHQGYKHAARARAWRDSVLALDELATPSADAALSRALLHGLCRAIEALDAAARGLDTAERATWSELVAATPELQVRAVLDDLGIRLKPSDLDFLVRQFTGDPRRGSSKTIEARRAVAAKVVVGSRARPLSVPYEQLLDEFNLIGTQPALGFLYIAHGLEVATHVSGDNLVSLLRVVWAPVEPNVRR